ncbi:MAG: VPLPA-CTERM sorting domain-containing protein [Thermodesulfobacteriota bacterium]
MKNKALKTISTLTTFVAITGCYNTAHASTVSATAQISNLTLTFSSTSPYDIYFFPGQKNSYSQARTADNIDLTNPALDDQYLVDGWGNTSAYQTIGTLSNGSSSSSSTTVKTITSAASAYTTEGTFSADAYGANWVNFYTYNPVTVSVSFDYLLSQNSQLDTFNEIPIDISWNLNSQAEIRFYQGVDSNNNWILDYMDLWGFSSDPSSGHITLSFTAGKGQYGRFEALAYSKGAIDQHPVPLPAAVWLLGSGLLGMIAIRRKSSMN